MRGGEQRTANKPHKQRREEKRGSGGDNGADFYSGEPRCTTPDHVCRMKKTIEIRTEVERTPELCA